MIKVAVILGDALRGFELYGPFEGFDSASRWGEKENHHTRLFWQTMEIYDTVRPGLQDANGGHVVVTGNMFKGGIALMGIFNLEGAVEYGIVALKQGPALVVKLLEVTA